jgi:hypothetical protein
MSRIIRAAAAAVLVAGGLSAIGCVPRGNIDPEGRYRNAVDTNWPDRYSYAARQSVLAPFGQQAANGHFMNQTVWNWYFEPGTDKLTPAGLEKLDSLARQTPAPDTKIYIQAARDLRTTAENVDTVGTQRDELTAKRGAAVRKYMSTQPGNPVAYEIYVHDAPVPGMYAEFAATAWRGQRIGYVGGVTTGGAGATTVSSGSTLGTGASGTGVTAPSGVPGTGTPGGSNPPRTGP